MGIRCISPPRSASQLAHLSIRCHPYLSPLRMPYATPESIVTDEEWWANYRNIVLIVVEKRTCIRRISHLHKIPSQLNREHDPIYSSKFIFIRRMPQSKKGWETNANPPDTSQIIPIRSLDQPGYHAPWTEDEENSNYGLQKWPQEIMEVKPTF